MKGIFLTLKLHTWEACMYLIRKKRKKHKDGEEDFTSECGELRRLQGGAF